MFEIFKKKTIKGPRKGQIVVIQFIGVFAINNKNRRIKMNHQMLFLEWKRWNSRRWRHLSGANNNVSDSEEFYFHPHQKIYQILKKAIVDDDDCLTGQNAKKLTWTCSKDFIIIF